MLTPAAEATCPIFTAAPLTLDLSPDSTLAAARRGERGARPPGSQPMDLTDRSQPPPVACALDGTPGAFAERMAEYRRLFGEHLAARSRSTTSISFRFRAGPGRRGLGPRPGPAGEALLRFLRLHRDGRRPGGPLGRHGRRRRA